MIDLFHPKGHRKMKKCIGLLYRFSSNFIVFISLILTGILWLSAALFTSYSADMESQLVLFKQDFLPLSLLGVIVFLLLFFGVTSFAASRPDKRKRILLCLVCMWITGVGLALILFGKTVPAADSMAVFSLGEEMAKGNMSVIHPTDSYISYYPQQIGLVAFYEILIRLWNLLPLTQRAYPAIQALYVLLASVIVYFQYKTVHLLWENDRADCIYLLLAGANVPLIMYTSFVYGEIPSFAALSAGIFGFLRLLKGISHPDTVTHPKTDLFCSLFMLTLGVLLRKNSLIILIAILLVALLEGMKKRSGTLLVFALLCTVLASCSLPLVEKIYEHRAGNTISSGVPAISYFAMGMQESSRAEGWYNGFNFNTYRDSGMNTEITAQLSREAIHSRLADFSANPGYALHFYGHKFISQWCDGTYACRQATYATDGSRHTALESLYSGELSSCLIAYCNTYQNIIYLGVLIFCILSLKRRSDLGILIQYLGLIGVLGGFLFHMIWEANSRYIFHYGLLLLPYAAFGLEVLIRKLRSYTLRNPAAE